MDLGALPSTIDFQGPNGATFYRATQLSYTYKGLKDFRFQASIEAPAVDGTTSSQFEIAQQRMPGLHSFGTIQLEQQQSFACRRYHPQHDIYQHGKGQASSVTGYGVQASTTFNLGKKWQAFGQINYGKGIGQYLNDISNLNVDIVPNPEKEGKMQALPMLAGMQVYNITFLQRYSFQALTACPAFTLKTVIPTTCQVPTATDSIS